MSLILRRQDFRPSCPSGGTWYACGSGSNFVGCCNSFPCDLGCPDGNLEPASFDPAFYGQFPDQDCPTGSTWHTCAATTPPFMGCCKSDPCTDGCPQGDITAGFLSSNKEIAAAFNPSGGVSAISTSSPKQTATSGPSLASAVPAPRVATNTPATSSHIGAIVGGAVGGIIVVALVVVFLMFYYQKKTSASRQHMSESRLPPDKPIPTSIDNSPGESFVHDQKQDSKNGNSSTVLVHTPGPTSFIAESQVSTPAPVYPTSPSLPEYPSSVEMDSLSPTRPQQSPSPSFHKTFPPSGEYSPKAPSVATSSRNHLAQSGSYTAYIPTNPPPVLSPLASPVAELDGTTSAGSSHYSLVAHQSAMDRQGSGELCSTDSIHGSERPGEFILTQLGQAKSSNPSPRGSYNRAPLPPAVSGGWVNR